MKAKSADVEAALAELGSGEVSLSLALCLVLCSSTWVGGLKPLSNTRRPRLASSRRCCQNHFQWLYLLAASIASTPPPTPPWRRWPGSSTSLNLSAQAAPLHMLQALQTPADGCLRPDGARYTTSHSGSLTEGRVMPGHFVYFFKQF